ncbi:hypothetical protein HK102_001752 [Quaeritorhiza haematococci]|nr:hypothetical protein HK102_001752 [Quaeritorhiza haematococci]
MSSTQRDHSFYTAEDGTIYVTDVAMYINSTHAAPVHDRTWTSPDFFHHLLQLGLPLDEAYIFIYNKSRKTARICPACHKCYKVQRQTKRQTPEEKERELSGICSPECFVRMTNPNSRESGCFGRAVDEIEPEEFDRKGITLVQNQDGSKQLLVDSTVPGLGEQKD